MDSVAITLLNEKKNIQEDLLLPLDTPVYLLGDVVAKSLGLAVPDTYRSRLSINQGGSKQLLPIQKTLRNLGICHGQYLYLKFEKVIGKAILLCERGPNFIIKNDMEVIGCSYGDSHIDIDLTGVPNYEFVSGKHAKIYSEYEQFYLVDLDSTNGTKLNDELLEGGKSYKLKDGDCILLSKIKEKGVSLMFEARNL